MFKIVYATGDVVGSFNTLFFVACTPAIGSGANVFCSTDNPSAKLYAIDKNTMDYAWFATTGYIGSSPVLGPDGSVVAALGTGSVIRWNADTGVPIWQRSGLGGAGGILAFSRDDTKVFVPNGTHMTALNWADGSIVWDRSIGTVTHGVGVASNGTLVFGSESGLVTALNPNDGTVVWSYNALDAEKSPPAFSPDGLTCYIGSVDFRLYSLDVLTGHRNWSFSSSYWILGPPTVGMDGSIYFDTRGSDLYRLDPSGHQIWQVRLKGWSQGSMTLGPDGTLYVPYQGDTESGLAIIRQQATTYPVSSFTIDRGRLISGGLQDVQQQDGHYLVVQNGATLFASEPPIRVVFTASSTFAPPTKFTINLVDSVSMLGLNETIEAYNNSTNTWTLLYTRAARRSDSNVQVDVGANAAQYRDSSGNIKIRVGIRPGGPLFSSAWTAKFDLANLIKVVPSFVP